MLVVDLTEVVEFQTIGWQDYRFVAAEAVVAVDTAVLAAVAVAVITTVAEAAVAVIPVVEVEQILLTEVAVVLSMQEQTKTIHLELIKMTAL